MAGSLQNSGEFPGYLTYCLLDNCFVLVYNLTGKRAKEMRMRSMATTKMSSKGQVVIPEDIRRRLELDAGTQFIVLGEDDVVILKMVRPPSMADFDRLVTKAKKQARAAGLTRSDVSAVVSRVRKSR